MKWLLDDPDGTGSSMFAEPNYDVRWIVLRADGFEDFTVQTTIHYQLDDRPSERSGFNLVSEYNDIHSEAEQAVEEIERSLAPELAASVQIRETAWQTDMGGAECALDWFIHLDATDTALIGLSTTAAAAAATAANRTSSWVTEQVLTAIKERLDRRSTPPNDESATRDAKFLINERLRPHRPGPLTRDKVNVTGARATVSLRSASGDTFEVEIDYKSSSPRLISYERRTPPPQPPTP